jgi:hypothetical protein
MDISMENGDKTFVKISNKDIYKKLETMETKLDRTCGQVKVVHWIATTAITLSIATIGFIFYLR